MATTHSPSTQKSGTWVVIGLLALAVLAVIVSRVFYFSSDSATDVLQQEGLPAARQGMALSQQGKKLLPMEEQREMDAIYAEAFTALSTEERQRFMTLGQKGTAVTDAEITESATLLDKALRSLAPERGTRLWELVSKAVKLAQQQAPASS
ncbi:MAG: hypothetical protein FJ147_08285 [Deltaproteobacteria bacterium]|nr:hypothetical protein [Deltaproteobacteria bacterium]